MVCFWNTTTPCYPLSAFIFQVVAYGRLKTWNFNFFSSKSGHSRLRQLSPLTPGGFRQKRIFLDILEIFSLEMDQISLNLLKKAFATWQPAFLSTSTTFYDVFARACAENLKFVGESDLCL